MHVDDSIMGFPLCTEGQPCKEELKSLYTWGSWDTHSFKLCGVQYLQDSDCSIQLTQKEYTDAIKFAQARRLTKHAQKLSDSSDVKILRGINGEVQWLASNTRPDLAAGVSISAGNVNKAEIWRLSECE